MSAAQRGQQRWLLALHSQPLGSRALMLLKLQVQHLPIKSFTGRRGFVRGHAVAPQTQLNGRPIVPALPDVSGLKLAPERPVWHAPKPHDDEEKASSSYESDDAPDEYRRRALDSADASTSGRNGSTDGSPYSKVLLRHGLLPAPPDGWQSWHTRLPAHGKAGGSTCPSTRSVGVAAAGQRDSVDRQQPGRRVGYNGVEHAALANGHANGAAAAAMDAWHTDSASAQFPSQKQTIGREAANYNGVAQPHLGAGKDARLLEEAWGSSTGTIPGSSTGSSTQGSEERQAYIGMHKQRHRQARRPPAWLGTFSYLPSAVPAATHDQDPISSNGSSSTSTSSSLAAHDGRPAEVVVATRAQSDTIASHPWTQQQHHSSNQAPASPQPAGPAQQLHTAAARTSAADSEASSSAAGVAAVVSSLSTLRGRRNRFMDERFELAISAWVKQAPDWFAVQRIVEANLSRLNILHVAVIAHKLAQLTSTTQRSMLNKERSAFVELLGRLVRHAVLVSPGLDGRTACNLLHSLAKLQGNVKGLQIDTELLQVVLLRLQPFLPSVKPQELASGVWALGMLRHQPDQSWLDAMYAATESRLQEFQPGHLAALMSGLALLQVTPPASWTEALLSSALSQLDTMRSRELSMMLMALGRLRLRPSTEWLETVLDEVKQRLDSLGCQALANILWALARLGYTPKHSWWAAYCVASSQLLNSFNPQELSITIWALATLHTWPNDQWLDDFFNQTQEAMRYFSPQHLANTSWALAKLGLNVPKSWIKEFVGQVVRCEKEGGLTGPIVHQLMYALAWFKVPSLARWRLRLYDAVGFKVRRTRWRRQQQEQGQEGGMAAGAGSGARSVAVTVRGPGDVDVRRVNM